MNNESLKSAIAPEVKQMIKINCEPIFRYDVIGVTTHYTDKVWIDDKEEPEGGFYQNIEKRRPNAKVLVDFYADVDIDLVVNGIYSDGTNLFRAVGRRTIRNETPDVFSFKIPLHIVLIATH